MTIRVEVRAQENIDGALRRLRRLCSRERPKGGRRRRSRPYYEKPGERRRQQDKQRLRAIRMGERERGH